MKKSIKMAILAVFTVLGVGLYATPTPVLAQVDKGIEATEGSFSIKEIIGAGGIFSRVINFLLFLIGAISVLMIVFAGFQYATSAGDAGKVTTAKNTILYAIIGIVIALLAYAIVNFVTKQLNGTAA